MIDLLSELRAYEGKKIGAQSRGLSQWLDGRLLSIEKGKMKMEFEVRHEMCNPANILHGGIHAAILDDLMGFTVATLGLEYYYFTINLQVELIKPAQKNELVVATSEVLRVGSKRILIDAQLHNQACELLSRASSNLVLSSQRSPFYKP